MRPVLPNRIADVPGGLTAWALLDEAYRLRSRRAGRSLHHPAEVADLLISDGQPSSVVITGLLHDVLEDTLVTPEDLSKRVGPEISRAVEVLTEDRSIKRYRYRKAALRQKIVDSGWEAAVVSLADKIAKLRAMDTRPKDLMLQHFRATLTEIEARYGPSPLSWQLREELAIWT